MPVAVVTMGGGRGGRGGPAAAAVGSGGAGGARSARPAAGRPHAQARKRRARLPPAVVRVLCRRRCCRCCRRSAVDGERGD